MADNFDMKGGYKVVENTIIVDSTPAGVSLYDKSKDIIFQNAQSIDGNVALLRKCDMLLLLIDSNGKEKPEYAQDILNWRNFLNCACLIASFDMDFSISTRELMNAKNLPEQMYYVKNIYIHLYRYFERMNHELGVIKSISENYGLLQDYKDSSKSIGGFKNKYYSEIKGRRNKLYAHIKDNKNYLEYHKDCIEMKIQEEIDMCIEFLKASSTLNILLSKLLPIITTQIVAIQQNIAKENQEVDDKFKDALNKVRHLCPEMAEQLEAKIDAAKQKISDTISKLFKHE